MWRVVLAASMILTLAFGSIADAKCAVCLESVRIETEGGGTLVRFNMGAHDPAAFPETGTAVVMQFDGNRGKCLNVSLIRTGIDTSGGPGQWPAVATYVGRFNFVYQGATTLSGRADIAGTVWDFSAPIDGQPGTIGESQAGALNGVGAVITAPVTITPDPATRDPRLAATAAPEAQPATQAQSAPAAQPASPALPLIDSMTTQPVAWLGLVVIIVALVSAYFDRKRSIARATTG